MATAPDLVLSKLTLQPPLTIPITAKLEYKYYLDASWTLINASVAVATDGTFTPQTISGLDTNTQYIVRATNNMCGSIWEEYFNYPCQTTCPDGFVLSPDGTSCYQVQTIAATPPAGDFDILVSETNVEYGTCGSYIYDTGWNFDGTGTSNQITTANAFWCNSNGDCIAGVTTDGPLNRAGVWSSVLLENQDVGFSVCVNITEEKTYYVAIGCDNYGIIKLDGTTIIEQDETAMDAQYGVVGACFKIWSIYPIVLTAGIHYFEIFGHNVETFAAVGVEIYDNTAAEIIAATDYSGLNLIFSTKDEVGNPVLLGTNSYSCPVGYAVVTCESPVVCKKITTADTLC